jgi:hypothetical protein
MLPTTTPEQRANVAHALEEQQDARAFRPESDRGRLTSEILLAIRPPDAD